MGADQEELRRRGAIRRRGSTYQVRVYVGVDPVTGERVNLTGTATTARAAEKMLTRLLAEKDERRAARTRATVSTVLQRWLETLDVGPKTAHEYAGYVRRTIEPVLGDVPLSKLDTQGIESLYAQLRRCRRMCRSTAGLVDHRTTVAHTCDDRCRPHTCRPMAPATVRTVHAVLSGALSMAVRYGWIASNPAEYAVKPRAGRPQPSAPTSDQAARLIDAAFDQDADWGVLVWLVMVTGMRRSELAALRWGHVDLDRALIELRAGYVVITGQGGVEKDTKTHQMRFVRLDSATVDMLREHRDTARAQLAALGASLDERHFVFSADPGFDTPRNPDAITHRYRRMAEKLGIDTHLHALRHFSATELIAGGVDLRTVAGRLGHGDGTTTMKVYAAWVAAAGDDAAEIMASRMPSRAPQQRGRAPFSA